MRSILATLMLLVAGLAHAGSAVLTWEPPTLNCDKSPIGAISHYEVRWGQSMAMLPELPPFTYTVENLKPGDWWFNLAVVNAEGVSSDFVTAKKTIAPEDFVTKTTTVYTLIKRTDRLVLLPVGTVALGVQCDAGLVVNGKYGVPRASVTWSGSVKPDIVVGDCG